jgi:hypothetical protein
MEMLEQFEWKIRVQNDVHQIMIFDEHVWIIHLENYLLYHCNILMYMDANKYDIDLGFLLENNQYKK